MSLEIIESSVGKYALDVVVPTHNRIDMTMKCLLALYSHTQLPFHLIVVDDSTDNLTVPYFKDLIGKGVAPLPQCTNITFIHSTVPYKTGNEFFNLAFRYMETDYIATVMNSMRVEPDWEVYAINTLMKENPALGIIGFKCLFAGDVGNTGHIESAGIKMIKYLPTDMGRDLPGHRMTGVYECDAVQWAFALLRRQAVVGALEPYLFHGFKGWDDIDNCFQVKSKGWKIAYDGLGVGYHEPRSTRGDNSDDARRLNLENGEKFYKRWGFWDMFVTDHRANDDVHKAPMEIESIQEMQERTNMQPVRD